MAIVASFAVSAPVFAQSDKMVPIPTPVQADAIDLGTGALPNASATESWHSQYGSVFARNVTEATLTPFLPEPGTGNGTAVVVAPGGGFQTLSMENEGWDVARALAAKGVAAFVLKYRLNQTPQELNAFQEASARRMAPNSGQKRPSAEEMMANLAPQIADAETAFALIRKNAGKWNVNPDRIGMVGFSAGAMLTMVTTLTSEHAKPAFIGTIYGSLMPVDVPADAPPLFVALAADDPLFGSSGFGLIDSWRAAKRPVEFHLYEQGGHGFGMYQKTTTSTGWFDEFTLWMAMHGLLKPAE
ncbi:alpha/beta hydrolase [Altericroceibacterium indicum]|nr:alpha/beta hydrolase [Altericroceibacterium indicum]